MGIGNVVVVWGLEMSWSIESNGTVPTRWKAMPWWGYGIGNANVPFGQRGHTNLMGHDVPVGGTDTESETSSFHLPTEATLTPWDVMLRWEMGCGQVSTIRCLVSL